MDAEVSDESAKMDISFTTISNPDGSTKTVYVAPIATSKSKPKRPTKKQQEILDKEGAKDRSKAKSAKATSSRTKPLLSSESEQHAPTNQNLEAGPGGSSSTAQGLAPSPVASSDMHTMVRDSVMALLPELLKGLQAVSQASPGAQKATEAGDESSVPYGQGIRRLARAGDPSRDGQEQEFAPCAFTVSFRDAVQAEVSECRLFEPENGNRQHQKGIPGQV